MSDLPPGSGVNPEAQLQYSLIEQAKDKLKNSKIIKVAAAVALALSGLALDVSAAEAACAGTHCDAQGTVELSGGAWLYGEGVDIYANQGSAGYDSGIYNYVNNADGRSTQTGEEWQCVELINRLYLTRGWIRNTWSGNGNQLFGDAPANLVKESEGHVSYLNVGDVITLDDGRYGHAGVVNSYDGASGAVDIVNQNTVDVHSSARLTNGTLTMNGWSGYSVQGVVHRPVETTSSPEAPKPQPGLGPGMKFRGTDHLSANEIMGTGEYILSQNAQYLLALQTDGNLVLYGIGFNVLWTSNTANSGATYVGMQSDGNLVLYTGYNRAVWSSNTGGHGASSLSMQDDGNLVLYDNNLKSTWATSTDGHPSFNYYGSDILDTSKVLQRNQYIRSGDKRYGMLLQSDGNLVLYGPGYHVLWASGTDGKDGAFAGMQPDGNLVLYNSANQAIWSSNTAGRGNSFAALQSDGNLVVYTNSDKTPTWNSGTSGKL